MDASNTGAEEAEALARAGRWQEAAAAFAKLVVSGESNFSIHYNYGTALLHCGDFGQVCGQMDAALRFDPASLEALNNLSAALLKIGNPCSAEETCRRILERSPDHALAWTNLGLALSQQGRVAEGIEALRRALDLDPGLRVAQDNLLLHLNYLATDAKALAAEHRYHCAGAPALERKPLPVVNERRIRVGYVSSDFRSHSVAYFIGGIIGTHDRAGFEVFCYSATHVPDRITGEFARIAEHFIDIAALSDVEAAARVERDGIDILVDLGGHTSGNRLGVFARRPAPVQVSYLGYPATTGCAFLDFRIVDGLTDPVAEESMCTERLVRLPAPFLCYSPTPDFPETAPLPALAQGHVTFGSFNNSSKISDSTVDLWSRTLAAVAGSRLFIKSRAFSDSRVCDLFRQRFAERGVDGSRLSFSGLIESATEHLAAYERVDIALDTYPYNGTTTTCEALWMGVPVVSLTGGLHASRVGSTLLTAVGLGGFAAPSPEAFVARARWLSDDLGRLAALRGNLRGAVARSPLCDRKRFVKGLEDAYRGMLAAGE